MLKQEYGSPWQPVISGCYFLLYVCLQIAPERNAVLRAVGLPAYFTVSYFLPYRADLIARQGHLNRAGSCDIFIHVFVFSGVTAYQLIGTAAWQPEMVFSDFQSASA